MVYKRYATEERNLQIQAVEALRRHEEQLFGRVKDIDLPHEEPRQGRWSRPSVKMLRMSADQLTRQLEEEEKKRLHGWNKRVKQSIKIM